jgi:hypothetical protein
VPYYVEMKITNKIKISAAIIGFVKVVTWYNTFLSTGPPFPVPNPFEKSNIILPS